MKFRPAVLVCAMAIGTAMAAPAAIPSTPFIVVDQFGYLPDQAKVAILRDPQVGFDAARHYRPGRRLEVVDAASGRRVFSGAPAAWNKGTIDRSSGDRAWWFDFSALAKPGRYRIVDRARAVRSPPFTVGSDVYRPVLVQAVRMLFYQRAGFAKEARFAGAKWADGASHMGPLQDRHARLYSAPGDAATERDLHGGWFDAGDFNRYAPWAGQDIVELLNAFRERPAIWTDDYGIPESGDGIPDLLNEVDWEVDWLRRMQNDDGAVLAETASALGSPPSSATGQSLYGTPSSYATSSAAAAFAVAAIVYRGQPRLSVRAPDLAVRAEHAWAWVVAHPKVEFRESSADNGKVRLAADLIETDDAGRAANMLAAAAYLFELTAKPVYRAYVDAHLGDLGNNNFYAITAIVHYAAAPGASEATARDFRRTYAEQIGAALDPALLATADPYRAPLPDYGWGSNWLKARMGLLFVQLGMNGGKDASAAATVAADYLHYLHGVNPLGKVYLSNMAALGASNSVDRFFHSWFADGTRWSSVSGSPNGPPPGYLVGGPNQHYSWEAGCPQLNPACGITMPAPPAGQPPQKSYKDFNTSWPIDSWSVTEPDLLYQVAFIRLLSKFVR